ncbi:hypothetical protein SAMN05660297_00031 [Natronincola peptidivorans]|uniref:Uncharacterized protein n=1 Tax=Natronincola peptidivorans TaxID=426128 RepID=A0A1H9Y515_9FIRM|nr:hypothetical protein [Natronincola peptidivorans]SES63792.1 hypothetical protein SAMN05660297_00031 [Natronincola peptidivorans]
MPNTIVGHSEEIINFLEDVNYGMNKPQFNHLATIIEGSIHVDGKVSYGKLLKTSLKLRIKAAYIDF